MIETEAGLDLTRKQLARAEDALAAIRREVLPVNEGRYRLMAESYIGQIRDLRAQIDAYLGIEAELSSTTAR